jgi:hypothetical protein
MFSGRDRILVSDTRLFTTENKQVHELSIILEADLVVLSHAVDRIIEWGLDTLNSTPWGLQCWLRSPKRSESDWRPFKKSQERRTCKDATLQRVTNHDSRQV